jgi:hypothetical protein
VGYGTFSIKAQIAEHETPMLSITAVRNALGAVHGGSNDPVNDT